MHFNTKLRMDHWVGSWIIFFLFIPAWVLLPLSRLRARLAQTPSSILLIKFVGIGSVAKASFLIGGLRKKYPHSKIVFLCFPETAQFVRHLPDIDDVWVVRDNRITHFFWDSLKVGVRCLIARFDWVVDLEVFSKYSSILSFLTFARRRIGFYYISSRFRRELYTHLVFWNLAMHVNLSYERMAQQLAIEARPDAFPNLRLSEPDLNEMRAFKKHRGILPGEKLVLINPNAGPLSLLRRWPAENFTQLGSKLAERGITTVWVGAKHEKSYVNAILSRIPPERLSHQHNAAGELSFAAFLALLQNADVLVTNDSGPLHLADLLGTRCVSLWGPTSPSIYGPTRKNHVLLYEPVPCSPCLHVVDRPPCGGDNYCIKKISCETVFESLKNMLEPAV